MEGVFLHILNMSIASGYVIIAAVLLRFLLKKAPKWISVILWGIVGLRFCCPFSIQAVFSLIPSARTVSPDIMTDTSPTINSGIPLINNALNPVISETFAPALGDSVNPLQVIIPVLSVIWLVGLVAMLGYSLISCFRLKSRLYASVKVEEGVYKSEQVASPFLFGVFSPKIYLPFGIDGKDADFVIAHERAHIRRKDHLWKPLGFLILSVHWFNPLAWLAYLLLCRDIELACDQRVIESLGREERADYSEAILKCSISHRTLSACPLAFGEVGVKSRVSSVLSYKKPALWVTVIAVIACISLALCFLTDPIKISGTSDANIRPIHTEYDGVYVLMDTAEGSGDGATLHLEWYNNTDRKVLYGESFSLEYRSADGWQNVALEEHYFHTIGYNLPKGGSVGKKYSLTGYDLSKDGRYRLVAPFIVENGEKYDSNSTYYYTYVEFNVKDGTPSAALFALDPVETVYCDPLSSYIQFPESAPTYLLSPDMHLYKMSDGEEPILLGRPDEITLTEESFDSRFLPAVWTVDGRKLDSSELNNSIIRTWELKLRGDGELREASLLYMLFLQNDGTLYMAEGFFDLGTVNPQNPDDSRIHWVYKLKPIGEI